MISVISVLTTASFLAAAADGKISSAFQRTPLLLPPRARASGGAFRSATATAGAASRDDGGEGGAEVDAAAGAGGGGPTKEEGGRDESLRRSIEGLVSALGETRRSTASVAEVAEDGDDPSPPLTVHLVGTGLCPTLSDLSLSTLLLLSRADVVLHDSLGLSSDHIGRVVREGCEVICVGKRGDRKSWRQDEIDELLLQKATEGGKAGGLKSGRTIVRLKGGDPFLFGRARSEIEALQSAGVQHTYTPGISSCVAGPHLGGIPLTDPSLGCQSFGVWSGTDALGRGLGSKTDENRWQHVGVDVLVFLMIGRLDKLDDLCRSIVGSREVLLDSQRKWDVDTPCAVVQNAGGEDMSVWRSTLGSIVEVIRRKDRTSVSPAVFVVGDVATLDLSSC
ncbi:hypothetical protein ACHAWF_003832 [Thalassiosira exigua]